MHLFHRSLHWLIKLRLRRLEHAIQHPIESQERLLMHLIEKSKFTQYGQQFHYHTLQNKKDFKLGVPICTYEAIYPYINQILQGQQNVLWPSPIKWFAKSSGTTNDRSKFIPISTAALQEGHYKAGKDLLAIYLANYPNSQLAQGKSIGIGGSLYDNTLAPGANMKYGDVSAVLMQNMPFWAKWISTPSLDIALLDQWEEKLEKLATLTAQANISAIAGIPTWVLLLLQKMLTITHKTTIQEVWPNLELFIHGGISFGPYKALFQHISASSMHYLEVYNASEGFFAIQDQPNATDLLLLVDHGIFYEFMPIEELGKENPQTIDLEAVELGKIYAMIITTNAGLWRYHIGDTIKFTCLHPYRIKIAGRTKHFINAFGEELVIENAETAISKACELTSATISNYTAGPHYIKAGKQGSHEWLIEFIHPPKDPNLFVATLDKTLQAINSDYEAKRYQDLILAKPIVRFVNNGVFYHWMKKQGKLGEQHKVPRLSNDRRYLADILCLAKGQYTTH